jgi:hypothetical protein
MSIILSKLNGRMLISTRDMAGKNYPWVCIHKFPHEKKLYQIQTSFPLYSDLALTT